MLIATHENDITYFEIDPQSKVISKTDIVKIEGRINYLETVNDNDNLLIMNIQKIGRDRLQVYNVLTKQIMNEMTITSGRINGHLMFGSLGEQ